MSTPNLHADIAELLTDLGRVQVDLSDPFRHSKRKAAAAARSILSDAVIRAREVLEIGGFIDQAHSELKADFDARTPGRPT